MKILRGLRAGCARRLAVRIKHLRNQRGCVPRARGAAAMPILRIMRQLLARCSWLRISARQRAAPHRTRTPLSCSRGAHRIDTHHRVAYARPHINWRASTRARIGEEAHRHPSAARVRKSSCSSGGCIGVENAGGGTVAAARVTALRHHFEAASRAAKTAGLAAVKARYSAGINQCGSCASARRNRSINGLLRRSSTALMRGGVPRDENVAQTCLPSRGCRSSCCASYYQYAVTDVLR